MGALTPRLHMLPTGAVVLLLLVGCDSHQPASTMPVTVVTAGPRATATITPAPRAAPTAPPSPAAPTLADMHPRKTFVDPPLPPELLDDGGLRPLPPTPTTPPTR